nr:MAG TPA: protein of unknown function (DUF2155) [Caudoviricetes sp.]
MLHSKRKPNIHISNRIFDIWLTSCYNIYGCFLRPKVC